jgi:LacI family transcriptional regulator
MKPKLKDVAKMADVSMSTASMVFSDTGRISEETRVKVLNAADFLGYTKKQKQTQINKSSNIGILYSIDPEWAFILFFIQPVIAEIEKELKRNNLNTVLIPISHHSSNEEIIKKLQCIGCKAVVSMHYGNERLLNYLENNGMPAIVVMNKNFQNKFYSVCVDNFQGAWEGSSFLLDLGHRNILYIDFQRSDLPLLSSDRFIGFKKALDERGIEFPEENKVFYNPEDRNQCRNNLKVLFKSSNPPTAIFCLDDDVAGRAISLLAEMGLNVPGDVSVIAPGDVLDYSMPYVPRITTMRIDTTYLGRITAQMMINRLTHNPEEVHVLKVKQQLVRRGSCREI